MTANSVITGKEVPGPRGHPIVGSLFGLAKDPLAFIMETSKTYGGLFAINVGPVLIYFVSDPDYSKHILQDNRINYTKGGMWNALRRIFSNGLFTSEGDFWLRQRRLMQPAFHRQRLAGLTTLMTNTISQTLDGWEQFVQSGESFSISQEMVKVALNVFVNTLFSRSISDEEIYTLSSNFHTAINLLNRRMWLYFLPARMPLPGDQRFREAINAVDSIIYRVIEERRQSGQRTDDLLSMLIDARDEETGEMMDNRQLRDEVLNLFLAGFETTALTLSWLWYLLGQNPEAMQRVQQEIEEVLGNRPPTFDDLSKLKYTTMVINETLRLYATGWIIPRATEEDDVIDGYKLKAGATVLICTYALHRNPQFWENPEQFYPERFADEHTINRFAYLPFGGGPRLCIGNNFALMEMQLMVALTIQKFHLSVVNADSIKPKILTTLQPSEPIMATAQKRSATL